MTDTQRSFEGRPLAKPDAELVDQGLQFDVTTLLHRRGMLKLLGVGFGAATLAACDSGSSTSASSSSSASGTASSSATSSSASGTLSEIPDETAGPYPGDGSNGPNVLKESGIVRQDIRSSFGTSTTTAEGIPMTLKLTVLDMAKDNAPFAGVAVYVWHCDRDGNYSMYSDGVTDQNYLRGVQVADANGVVTYTSIFPACYSGRWPHIHFEVYPDQASITDSSKAIATSQVALPKEICDTVYATTGYTKSVSNLAQLSLTSDNVFGDDGGVHELATATGDTTSGYTVSLTVPVDTSTTPTAGSAPSGGGGAGNAGSPPGPPPSS